MFPCLKIFQVAFHNLLSDFSLTAMDHDLPFDSLSCLTHHSYFCIQSSKIIHSLIHLFSQILIQHLFNFFQFLEYSTLSFASGTLLPAVLSPTPTPISTFNFANFYSFKVSINISCPRGVYGPLVFGYLFYVPTTSYISPYAYSVY